MTEVKTHLYDTWGNIISRNPRYGSGRTVALTYTGDRFSTRKVGTAAAVSFSDDSFARMTTDAEAGLSITYNAVNLPETVSMGNTLKAKYTYLSDGTKVSALDASGAGLVYRVPFTYRRSSGGTLAFESAPFDRGRLTEAGARYHVTDHLGSVRAVIDGNASTTTYPLTGFYSVDDFAPFGVKSASSASSYLSLASTGSTVSLRDGFTGQEDQSPDFGVGYSDFGARQYSPTLSRWLVPDPMGEKYYDVSPYAYCAGNPVNLVDPEGKEIWIVLNKDQKNEQRLQYESGTLLYSNGDVYTGDDSFALQVLESLNRIESMKDERIQTVILTMVSSPRKHIITKNTTNQDETGVVNELYGKSLANDGIKVEAHIKVTLQKRYIENNLLNSPTITIGHELMHAYDYDQGNFEGMIPALSGQVDPMEVRAVFFENLIRKELGFPRRTVYSGQKITPEQFNKVRIP